MAYLLHWTGTMQTAGRQDRAWCLACTEAGRPKALEQPFGGRSFGAGETWGDTAWKLGGVACDLGKL